MLFFPSLFRLLAVTVLLGLFTACNRTSPVDQARAENTLLITVGTEPSSLDPHRSTGAPESNIMSALWEGLIKWSEDATGFEPAAAESWELSADDRTYTFHLRPDAKWSNGEAVTARDWVRSFQRFLTPSLGAELGNFADPIVGAKDYRLGQEKDFTKVGIREINTLTLEIELAEPDAMFLDRLPNYPWYPVHETTVTESGDFYDPLNNFLVPGKLVSNGAFMLTQWRHDQFVEVTANPHFYRPARLSKVRFLAMGNLDTEERAFRSGQLHITSGIPASKIAVYAAENNPALHQYRRVGSRYMAFNTARAPFDDPRVRRAFAMALNRQQITEFVLRTGGSPAYAFVGNVPTRHEPSVKVTEDIKIARALLAEAGYPDGEGLPAVEYLYNSNDRNRQVAEAVQQMWRSNLGVAVELRNEEWKVFLDSRRQGDFQISRAGWLPFSPEPAELYELISTPSPSNETNWSNPEYDRLIEIARREMNAEKRRELYHQLDQILLAEMPIIPIGHYSISLLVDPSVEGWTTNALSAYDWEKIGFKN
ncbi:MAG: ABC transporter substrate-binding protein [Synoicihabitans sp.]